MPIAVDEEPSDVEFLAFVRMVANRLEGWCTGVAGGKTEFARGVTHCDSRGLLGVVESMSWETRESNLFDGLRMFNRLWPERLAELILIAAGLAGKERLRDEKAFDLLRDSLAARIQSSRGALPTLEDLLASLPEGEPHDRFRVQFDAANPSGSLRRSLYELVKLMRETGAAIAHLDAMDSF